ncbi:MAG: metallophosphoesterase, partial [Nanoarchaeota archaeon]
MKILAASDLHGDLSSARKLSEKAKKEGAELIILGGDILSGDDPHGIIGEFKKNNQKVLLVPGNHDS